MKIVIKDANIVIDLITIGLIKEFMQLGFQVNTSDFVMGELNEEHFNLVDEYARKGQVIINGFDSDELEQIFNLNAAKNGLSVPDCSVYYLANKLSASILTGDRKLRNYADQMGIEVHGILWIFDQLVDNNIISKMIARQKLLLLKTINSRLPEHEIDIRLNKWK